MEGDFLTVIRAKYNQFTKAEKRVADYVLKNPRAILLSSITDLAELCSVGDTSVFRFCKTMGLKGYQEFKVKLSLSLRDGKPGLTYLEGEISREDTFPQMVQKVLQTNINALQESVSVLDEVNFNGAIDKMYEAPRICFFGAGTSVLTAMKAANKFQRILPNVVSVQDSHIQAMTASTMSEGEVAVIFSYSGSTKDTIEVAKLAKGAGACVICITRFVKSPLTSFSEITLLCGANESPLQRGSTSAELSQMFLIDLMYTEYYRRHFDECQSNYRKTADSVLDKQY